MPTASNSPRSPILGSDKAAALALTPVSRETEARLDRYVELLLEWQAKTNLVAPSTLPNLWTRHISDSLQLLSLAPSAKVWVDFGSGGGFPGLVLACALAETPGANVHLVERNAKKAAFLREAVRVLGLVVSVHDARAETLDAGFICVTMRAVDRMSEAVSVAAGLVAERGWLALMTTLGDQEGLKRAAGAGFEWAEAVKLPGGSERILALGRRSMLGIDSDRAGWLGLGHGV